MKELNDLREVKKELHAVSSCASGTDRFMARCFPLMIKQNQDLLKLLSRKINVKRSYTKSDWQRFLAIKMKEGFTIKQCSALWKNRDRRYNAS